MIHVLVKGFSVDIDVSEKQTRDGKERMNHITSIFKLCLVQNVPISREGSRVCGCVDAVWRVRFISTRLNPVPIILSHT